MQCGDCFSTRFKWLIHENAESRSLIRQLSTVNLFINAEISVLKGEFSRVNEIMYKMYDVYNNALKLGGKLNVTFDRFFIISNENEGFFTESKIQRRTKYGNRNQMTDVTLRCAVLVS